MTYTTIAQLKRARWNELRKAIMLDWMQAHSTFTRGDCLRQYPNGSVIFEELLNDGKIKQAGKRRYQVVIPVPSTAEQIARRIAHIQ